MSLIRDAYIIAARILGVCLPGLALSIVAPSQTMSTTTVQGTVYLANGAPGSGTLQITWPAFTTASSQAVTAGRLTANIGASGSVSVNLAPNLGSSPAGLFYTAVYHMSDGTTSTEYRRIQSAQLLGVFGGADLQYAAGKWTVIRGQVSGIRDQLSVVSCQLSVNSTIRRLFLLKTEG